MRFCALRVNSNAMDKGKPLACLAFLLHHPGDALYSHPILEGHDAVGASQTLADYHGKRIIEIFHILN
jgi:hypothetical protein